MSFYDDASLIMFPSGYKEDKIYSLKPTDGSGDLTFTRASTATRVGPDGLIEKVRTNLILQSNTFSNASWTKSGSLTVTGGQAGYDGTNNAWLLTKPAAGFTGISQTHSNTGIITGSFYLKAGTLSSATIRLIGTPDVSIVYNLTTGTITSGSGFLQRTITSVGEGWYRCTVSINSTASSSFALYPDTISATTAGTIFAQNAQLELGDIATDYIPTTTAAVSVGMTANVPRLDYSGGGCGKLLLEPQRTNLFNFSEQFNNAYWDKFSATITANTAISPDGTQNADTITGIGRIQKNVASTGTMTFSVFAKQGTSNVIRLNVFDGSTDRGSSYNLLTGVAFDSYGSPVVSVVNYGNGWYRLIITTTNASTSNCQIHMDSANTAFIWGAQLEAGSYVSSYVPTLASSVTRLADAASLSILPNSDMSFSAVLKLSETPIATGAGDDWFRIYYPSAVSGRAYGYRALFGFADLYALSSTSSRSIGWKQESGSIAKIFKSGVLAGTSTSGSYANAFTRFDIRAEHLAAPIRIEMFYFSNEALSDAEMISLTTI